MAETASLVVVGLGPGRWDDLTLDAQRALDAAGRVIVRTTRHPTVDALRARRPDLRIESFDDLYESAESFAALYPTMVERLLAEATAWADVSTEPEGGPLVYAVPGHPLIGEESVRRLRLAAREAGVAVSLVAGLSYVEPVCAALGLDPMEHHLQLLDATLLAQTPAAALMGVIQPTLPALVAQVYNRRLAGEVKLALGEIYPDDWEVTLVRWAGMPGEETVERLPLVELDRQDRADHLTTLYVPALDPLQAARVPEGLRYVVMRLRREPDGCPWDRQQTHQTLRRYVLEEAYEVAEVLDEWDGSPEVAEHLAEELGDLLLQVYLQAEIADQEDLFHVGDVYQHVTEKLIRRHPHVFGEVQVSGAEQVLTNWEEIKRGERVARGEEVAEESALRGVPRSAPALYQAYELDRKAAKVGFRWRSTDEVVAKVAEEARELAEAVAQGDKDEARAELGDVLFTLASLANTLGIQPEDALLGTIRRFKQRFEHIEVHARREGRPLETLTAEEWLAWWDEAKKSQASE